MSKEYTVKEVCEITGMTAIAVRIKIKSKEIKATIRSRHEGYRIEEEEVYKLMDNSTPVVAVQEKPEEKKADDQIEMDPEEQLLRERIKKYSRSREEKRHKINVLKEIISDIEAGMYYCDDMVDTLTKELKIKFGK